MESVVLCSLFLLLLIPLSDAGCADPPVLCCANQNNSCYRNCYCDEACVKINDCCPDYISTCAQHIQQVTLQLQAAVSFAGGPDARVLSDSVSQLLSQTFLQQSCKNCAMKVKHTELV